MSRLLCALALMLLLAGCYGDLDPCTFDKTVPACAVSQSKAQATIGAIDADRYMRATQSAIFLSAEGTKAAINAEATRQVVGADATHEAMRIEATRQALRAAATESAVVYQATRTSVNGEATKIALNVGGAIERSQAERAATPYSAVFNVVLTWFLIPAVLILAVFVYGRRMVHHATVAAARAMNKRVAKVIYGQANNPQLAFVTFDEAGQPARLITSEGLIGSFADLLNGDTALKQLNVPDELKLRALVEASTRSQAARISAATGKTPWENLTQSFYEETQPTQIAEPGRYQINVVSSTLEPMPQWLDEVDKRLLEAGHD